MNKFLLLLSGIILLGCAPNQAYHKAGPPYKITDNSKSESCSQGANEYLLGVVEFDDQGQFHDRQQLKTLLEELRKEAKTQGLIITTFVHGWHHSATEKDDNFTHFKELLSKINRLECEGHLRLKKRTEEKRKVVGVYLGWRGESVSIPYLNVLTFWDRKDTAATIGIQGGVTETLLELEKIVRKPTDDSSSKSKGVAKAHGCADRKTKGDDPSSKSKGVAKGDSKLVIIGHSFGGQIVYSALAQILLDRSVADGSPVDGVGDLIVLANPALEALRFANLYRSTQGKQYSEKQPTLMVILTSENDTATKMAFPMGRFFSTVSDTHRTDGELNEFEADITAIGHYEPFRNAELSLSNEAVVVEQKRITCGNSKRYSVVFPGNEEFSEVKLDRCSDPYYPYLMVKVDKEIINRHGGIWSEYPATLNLIRHLISEPTSPTISEDYLDVKDCFKDKRKLSFTSYNEKVAEVEKWELIGFQQLVNKKWDCAKRAFQQAHEIWPTYHNVEEIFNFLECRNDNQGHCDVYKKIIQDYSWGMPEEFKSRFQQSMAKCP